MNCLDKRTLALKAVLKGSRPNSLNSTFSTGTMSTQVVQSANSNQPVQPQQPVANPSDDPSFMQLEDCLKYFPTIKALASNRKLPVVLLYGERTHRKSHRYQEKGKSNKVIYPKEKRDFLQIMGLPGKMITSRGLDFSVRPEIDREGVRIQYTPPPSRSRSAPRESTQQDNNNIENNGTVMETVIDSTDQLSISDDSSSDKPSWKRSALNLLRKTSVGPHPRDSSGGRRKSSGKRHRSKRREPSMDAEIQSMLSCDSCSSSDEYESDSDVTEQDVAVPSNYEHKKNVQPEPFYGLNLTYATFDIEKIGVQNAKTLMSPFLRISVRGKCCYI